MGYEYWTRAAVLVAAVGQTLFVLFYLTLPWWRTLLGRALFLMGSSLMVVLDLAVLAMFWTWDGIDQTFLVLYWLMAVGVWTQFVAFMLNARSHKYRSVSHSTNESDLSGLEKPNGLSD